jgi:hypothetical protein
MSLVLIIGCASYGERKQLDMLEDRTEHYETALRWGKYEIARAFISSKVTGRKQYNLDALKKIKITSYKLLGRNVFEDNKEAEQKVEIRFYNIDNLIEKTITDNQTWIFDQDLENWFLSSGLPDFQLY